jgi:hypothetical protein
MQRINVKIVCVKLKFLSNYKFVTFNITSNIYDNLFKNTLINNDYPNPYKNRYANDNVSILCIYSIFIYNNCKLLILLNKCIL